MRGERLAAGVSISNERTKLLTELRIIDPEGTPLIELGESQSDEIDKAVHRIAVARALGAVGLGEMAVELSLPAEIGAAEKFLRPSEISRLRSERADRHGRAQRQIHDRTLEPLVFRGIKYEGRTVRVNDSQFDGSTPIRQMRVKQGVNRDLIEEIAGSDASGSENALNDRLKAYTANVGVKITTRGSRTTLTYGDIFFATLDLKLR